MKLSQLLHWLTGIVGSLAIIFIIFGYVAGSQGTVLSNTQTHWFIDAGLFLGIALWLGLATLIHQHNEK